MTSTSATVLPALRNDLAFDIQRDFEPIGMVSAQPLVLVVGAQSGLRSIADVVREARAKPGLLTSGTSGNGTLSHLATELFNGRQNTAITSVPYKGESALLPDLLNGTLAMGFINLPITIPQVKAGKLRALGVTTLTRSPDLPDVPTIAEAGVPGYETVAWFGVFAPAATPPEVVERLNAEINRILATPEFRETLTKLGTAPAPGTPEAFAKRIDADVAKWKRVVEAGKIKVD